MAEDYVKPKCPKCGRSNIRRRASKEFEEKPFHCNLCGFDWKLGSESKPEPKQE